MDKPTWSLILDAAKELGSGGAAFPRSALIDAVVRRDPARRADSIGPVLQGMTRNATGGVPSACGQPLERVSHGWYRLAETPVTQQADVSAPVTESPVSAAADVILVGCVKTKADVAQAAQDLYRSPLFERRRRYAEQHATRWYVLSAEHGLIAPDALVEPYDTALSEQSQGYRDAWGQWVVAKLQRIEGTLRGRVIEVHAGDAYVAPLRQPLSAAGAELRHPLARLSLGEQLSWYDRPRSASRRGSTAASVDADSATTEPDDAPAPFADLSLLDGPQPAPAFVYRWPDASENFDTGWKLTVTDRGQRYTVKIGLGVRSAYGRERRRLVVWINGDPVAEAVAADDYATSHIMLGLLKDADGRLVRPGDSPPPAYSGFPIVSFTDGVVGPYARNGLAVRLSDGDTVSWAAFALARIAVRPASGQRTSARVAAIPRQPMPRQIDDAARGAIVAAILRYGQEHQQERLGRPPQFTPHPEANQLILDNPFAFLLAVIFDQGIPAERAWRAPYDLRQRLGHLDPTTIATHPDQIRIAVAQAPALHRFVNRVPSWVVSAADKVTREYSGDARAIWADGPRAVDLAARLRAFPGISQKKSAMAVEILARDLGVTVEAMADSDIAYDVHVRRVFLRTGLAERDDLDHMVEVARRLHPHRPGELDFPTWLIGRRWCGPGIPDCADCVLHSVCPRDIDRASDVFGS